MEYRMVLDQKTIKHLSVEMRVKILKSLTGHNLTATDLSKKLGKHVTTIAEHLKKMERSGLVERLPSKNIWKYYSLTEKSKAIFAPKKSFTRLVLALSISLPMIIYGLFTLEGEKGVFQARGPVLAEPVLAAQVAPAINYFSLIILCAGLLLLGMLVGFISTRKSKLLRK